MSFSVLDTYFPINLTIPASKVFRLLNSMILLEEELKRSVTWKKEIAEV